MRRMPMGMVEYIADFFVSDEMRHVSTYAIHIFIHVQTSICKCI